MTKGSTWIVLADAGRARFFERLKPKATMTELEALDMDAPPVEQPGDRAPRVHDRQGDARHAIAPRQTPREAAADHFLHAVAARINKAAAEGVFARLVICAPPRALGILRDGLADNAKRCVVAAIDKDLMHEPVKALQAHLDSLAP